MAASVFELGQLAGAVGLRFQFHCLGEKSDDWNRKTTFCVIAKYEHLKSKDIK